MDLTHARTITHARSCLAALADTAATPRVGSAYDRVLLALDTIYGDDVPALNTRGLSGDRQVLRKEAAEAIEDLAYQGLDPLNVELLLAQLATAIEGDGR